MIAWLLFDLVMVVVFVGLMMAQSDLSIGVRILFSVAIISVYVNGFLTGLKADVE